MDRHTASHIFGRVRIVRLKGRIESAAVDRICRVFMSCCLFLMSVTCITTAFAIWQGVMPYFC